MNPEQDPNGPQCVDARAMRLVVATITLLAAGLLQAAEVAGQWQAEFDTQIGKQKYVYTLSTAGERITGKAAAEIGDQKRETELKEGVLKADEIAFVEMLEFEGNSIRIEYKGKISGDEIKFTRKVGDFATEELVAKRLKPTASVAASAPPKSRAETPAGAPKGAPGSRGQMRMPSPGPCPLPILPALAAYEDATFYARSDVPHGKVEQARYKTAAGPEKRMHVYLPPDYEKDSNIRYPVLYLNHGGGDDDSKWTTTDPRNGGNAQFILDNLIAAGKARPMIVVMPNTRGLASANPPPADRDDACTEEYLKDIIPHVEAHYRAKPGRENRALAGLSMGGFVVMNTGLSHLDTFSELYVFSSGYIGDQQQAFEDRFQGLFKDPNTNGKFRVPFYMAQGETDIALLNGQKVMAAIHKHGIRNFWVLSSGGHEWANWRRYLHQTAQIMFPADNIAK